MVRCALATARIPRNIRFWHAAVAGQARFLLQLIDLIVKQKD
jgi:hypothetical protein